ncbi:hypothetical protein [Bifidobacterium vansinderenii]|uniref:Uncharacterized protein n=1 Tax=Bifidobacterium vansinderenii TaxID=1984871 RepID=A0A229VY36_9BIFI|nr:hypothetical protein [Bifidobacterium vansinderenii]OXN00512.1 hypothetical protein Tam10B_1382 [Bifidobacterium vansinderenii]
MGRQKKLRLTPSWLPVVRDHLVKEGRRQAARGNLNGTVSERILNEFYNEMDILATSPLWWVSRDMKTVCVDTVVNGPRPPATEFPTVSGFIVFEDGFIVRSDEVGEILVDAVSWEQDYSEVDSDGLPGVMFRLFSSDHRVTMSGRLLDASLPIGPMANIHDDDVDRAVLAMMQTAFALMDQPSVTAVAEHRWDDRRDGPQPKSLRLAPKVKMIVLREAPKARTTDGENGTSGVLTHRFIVRGFYREQPYGPNHSLRRRQWIPPFVKGPAGTPLIVKDSVRIWRRL